jgi:glycosyl hydrolase family 26
VLAPLAGSVASTVPSPRAAAATCGKLLPPRAGAYFGAFPDFIDAKVKFLEDYVKASKINRFQGLIGRRIAWAYFADHWFRGLRFPRANVLEVWRNGQIPYIAFQPHSGDFYGPGPPQRNPEKTYTLARILAGDFDGKLRAWARAARATNIPILMEFGTEVNDDWGPWNGKWNGAGQTDGYGDPAYPDGAERFRDAFRHLVTLFREEGANNITWFFHADSYHQVDWWNELRWYYPGDEYIDWVGISNYGSLTPNGPILDFADKLEFSRVYTDLTALSKRPLGIVEMAVVDDAAGDKPTWIRNAFAAIRSGRFPKIRSAFWWDMRVGDIDTRADSSPAALEELRKALADPFFGARPRFTGNCGPRAPRKVTVTRRLAGKVRVAWTSVANAAHYEVWRTETGDGKRVLIGTTTRSTFDDTRAGGRAHSYAVRALNPLGKSGFSVSDSAFNRKR